jgi:hypothetical protein
MKSSRAKKIFVLDDDQRRIDWFRGAFEKIVGKENFTAVMNAPEAIAAWTGDYDAVFLDHDLGGRVFVNSKDENTGSAFVRALPEVHGDDRMSIVVHSLNPVGSEIMVEDLRAKGYNATAVPLGQLQMLWDMGAVTVCGKTKGE